MTIITLQSLLDVLLGEFDITENNVHVDVHPESIYPKIIITVKGCALSRFGEMMDYVNYRMPVHYQIIWRNGGTI